ncbi:hypothetical protein BN7_1642 [Wickerhamomyces ciferrii]|uniref:Mitochondrial glycine transporter n=1 Tax=Wickerhamomyces ciferrii (strain ATCC 14091 / BCRC 22168 / CBS 111 / JCM 3599 / NBRC 0793 / NRRL Y-1031 F-60-10) TaxID=1206466 RepID=K0KAS4_WICCF|nr:uncharacterized protein BN7_1642 [Wickerhamomyces ciferrii]CCH42100.1 hypothetical protein BN7_1642 [Wickerhamomyces ciferrii]
MSKDTNTTSHLIGGFAGGLTSSVILQPFDLLKTRLQQSESGNLKTTIKNLQSYKQLWRGTLPSAMRTSIGSSLYLATLNVLRTSISSRKLNQVEILSSSTLPKLSMTENLITGGATRGFVGFILMPITVLKVRYESTIYNYNSLSDSIKSIWKHEGIKGFFNGFAATAARDSPYAGLYVVLYEKFKTLLPTLFNINKASITNEHLFNRKKSAIINSTSAFLAASASTTITAPFDTIKTRMQLEPLKFQKFFKSFSMIIRNEGFKRLFDGLSLRLTRKAFSAGIAWGIYEEIIKFVNRV